MVDSIQKKDNKSNKSRSKEQDNLIDWVKKSIELLIHKSFSETIILSSYKLNTVLKEHYGVNLKVDRVGRALSRYAKQKNLKRLGTNIPKYELSVSDYLKNEKKQDNGKLSPNEKDEK